MSTTHKAHVIIRLHSNTPLKPTIAMTEAAVNANELPISVPFGAYRWANISSPVPNHPPHRLAWTSVSMWF
jgi:hypothetical protein